MKSIIFNQHQVNHALKNEEGVFRMVIKLTSKGYFLDHVGKMAYKPEGLQGWPIDHLAPYQVGQEIFVKETYEEWDDGLVYKADNQPCNIVCKWKSPVHMKQEHSRLTLRIKDVRVERLEDISEEDCLRDCVAEKTQCGYFPPAEFDYMGTPFRSPIDIFKQIWNSTHKKPEEKWEANPWVFRYGYEVEND